MKPRRPLPPKPFAWVDFPKEQGNLLTPCRAKPIGHDRWGGDYTGTLDCTLTLLTPLHVGSGVFRLANERQVVKEAVRHRGQLIIPGSSLKGVFRSIAEAISRSCVSKTKQSLPSDDFRECKDPEKLCVCCRLFGGLGYLGRVRFSDTAPADRPPEIHCVPPLWTPRRPRQGRKFYKHGQPATGKEPFEVLPAGTQFNFRVDVQSLTKDEMCLLLTAMGIIGDLKPKLGGGKPRCLGSAEVTLKQARLWSPTDVALRYERTERILTADELRSQVAKSCNLIEQHSLNLLKEILAHPREEECPPELY